MNKKIISFVIAVCACLTFIFSPHLMIESDKDIRTLAEMKVNSIQEMYNRNESSKIYKEGSDDFKKITSEKNFSLLMDKKKEVLGDFVRADLLVSNVINSNVVVLTYRSFYKNYSLIEEFKFIRKENNRELQLGTYFIDDGGKKGEVVKQ